MSIDYGNQTTSVPQSLLGVSNSNQSININSTNGIVFNDSVANLSATIAWSGITTTNPNGFNIQSKLNMNSNDITNVGTITATIFNGTASNANNIATTSSNANQNYYLPFVSSYATSSGQTLYTDQNYNITFNPSTGQLTTNGNISFPYGINIQDTFQYSYITSDNVGNMTIRSEQTSGQYGSINFLTEGFNLQSAYGSSATIIFDTRGFNSIGQPGLKITNGTYNNVLTSNNISCNNFTGSLNGTSTTAKNIATTAINTNATYYLPFVSASGIIPSQPLYTDANYHITYNPSTGVLSSTTFTGALSGNASTATTATNANNVAISDNNTSSTFYPTFASTNSGNLPLYVDKTTSPLSYVPSTGNLSATTFTGALSGNATTATTATNSNNSLIVSDNSSTTCYIPFTKSTASTGTNLPLYQDDTTGPLSYTPSTSTLSCSYGQFGSGIINTSSLACNSSGGLTITGGNSGGLILNSGANTLQLQQNGTTIATIQSTGLAVSQINANGFNIFNGTFSPFQIASSSGISTFTNIITTGLVLPTSINTATFSTNTLTIAGSTGSTFRNYQIGFTGTTNTISTLSLSSFPVNAEYYVTIYNGGSGTLTINATGLGTGIKTTYASNITVLTGGYAIMKINYIPFTTGGNIYVVSVNNIA